MKVSGSGFPVNTRDYITFVRIFCVTDERENRGGDTTPDGGLLFVEGMLCAGYTKETVPRRIGGRSRAADCQPSYT